MCEVAVAVTFGSLRRADSRRTPVPETVRLRKTLRVCEEVLAGLVLLAEWAMRTANRSGAEYDVEWELAEARNVLAEIQHTLEEDTHDH